ncbi:hypothetical protein [Halostella sp. PRR32]|uniref:hypothetical protein n=1 Tax=Halostella sp. PRR32 TaxID=3098147 RepID=UPI002B1D2903|nr:hypothetical protein [Halostella sp. PRR32]
MCWLIRHTEDVPEENDENGIEKRSDGLPHDVTSKATVTIKETNGNHYDYWQWRERFSSFSVQRPDNSDE